MTQKLAAALAAAVATVALAACGGYDPTEAVNKFNDLANQKVQSVLSSKGINGSTAKSAGIDLGCPTDVQKEQPFTCTVTGKLSKKTIDVQMVINSSEALDPAKNSAFLAALEKIAVAEAVIVAKDSAN